MNTRATRTATTRSVWRRSRVDKMDKQHNDRAIVMLREILSRQQEHSARLARIEERLGCIQQEQTALAKRASGQVRAADPVLARHQSKVDALVDEFERLSPAKRRRVLEQANAVLRTKGLDFVIGKPERIA